MVAFSSMEYELTECVSTDEFPIRLCEVDEGISISEVELSAGRFRGVPF